MWWRSGVDIDLNMTVSGIQKCSDIRLLHIFGVSHLSLGPQKYAMMGGVGALIRHRGRGNLFTTQKGRIEFSMLEMGSWYVALLLSYGTY